MIIDQVAWIRKQLFVQLFVQRDLSSATLMVSEEAVQSLRNVDDLVAKESDTSWLLLLTGAWTMQTGVIQTADIVTANL